MKGAGTAVIPRFRRAPKRPPEVAIDISRRDSEVAHVAVAELHQRLTITHALPPRAPKVFQRHDEQSAAGAIRLDPVSVGINHKGRVIARIIIGPYPRFAIIAAAGTKCCAMKMVYAGRRGCPKAKMQAGFFVGRDRAIGRHNPKGGAILTVAQRFATFTQAGVSQRF
jgi:hypothetical protein